MTERERIAMEQAVAASEKRYRDLFNGTPIGMYRTSLDGRLLECNPAMLRWLGLDNIAQIERVRIADHYADPDQRAELIRRVRETGVVRGFEVQFLRPDGTTSWVAIDLVRSQTQKDVLEGTIQDITSRKNAEREKARLEEELQASRRREAVAQLAAGIAHDFNNILTVIHIYATALSRRAEPQSPQGQISSRILSACQRAVALADKLLKSGEAEVRPSRIELNSIVRDTIAGLRTIGGATIAVQDELAAGDLFLEADPDQIQWSLLHLASNAVEAMPNGGTLCVCTGVKDQFAFLSVADTGAGMDEQTLKKLFEPYFTTKGFGTGAGHGLSRLHRIVTAHGGKIDVTSTPGQGTTVTVLLPLSV